MLNTNSIYAVLRYEKSMAVCKVDKILKKKVTQQVEKL